MRYLCILRIQPPSPRPVVMWSFLSSVSGCFPERFIFSAVLLSGGKEIVSTTSYLKLSISPTKSSRQRWPLEMCVCFISVRWLVFFLNFPRIYT